MSRSILWCLVVVLVALRQTVCTKSESIGGAYNEKTGLAKQGAISQQHSMQEKDLTIVKRQAIETDDRDVEYPQAQQGDKLMEMFEALNTSILTELDNLRRGQEALLSKLETCETEPEPELEQVYQDCHSAWERGVRASGVYTISPLGYQSFDTRCEFDNLHGWTVFQRRYDGSVSFYLPWADYKSGFGDPNTEYWLGNDNIYALTRTNRKLSIYLRRYDGQEGTANYSTFYINNEGDNYRLTISGYSGSVGDQMNYHNNQQFSTRDRDHDVYIRNCAVDCTGAWWYNNCYHSNLNGVWTSSSSGGTGNMVWYGSWSGGQFKPLQRTTMMVTRD